MQLAGQSGMGIFRQRAGFLAELLFSFGVTARMGFERLGWWERAETPRLWLDFVLLLHAGTTTTGTTSTTTTTTTTTITSTTAASAATTTTRPPRPPAA